MTSYYNKKNMKYSENTYHHTYDQRTSSQKEQQHQIVEAIVSNNLKTFNIELTKKAKIQYKPKNREKIDLGNQWYCYITDSKKQKQHTVLTLHGAPGDHVQWAGLEQEMGETCRWINFTFPGFDGQDERRGDFNGSMDHTSQLILRLLKFLNISKVIIVAHSLGSIFCTYFIPRYSHVVQGYVNVTGIVDHWYTGLMTFYLTSVADQHYNSKQWRAKNLFDIDDQREIIHKKFLQRAEHKAFGPVPFPKLTKTQYIAYVKLINSTPNGLSQLYYQNKKLKIFRVLCFGKKDPLHIRALSQSSIYNLCRNQDSYINLPQYKQLFSAAKLTIQKQLKKEFNIEIDASKLQQYFCYHLEDTGHNFHKRRPIEMSKILKIYISCLEVLDRYRTALTSKL